MRELIIKYLDIPFSIIFELFLLGALLTTTIFHFSISALWFIIAVILLDAYTIILIVYWVYLFVASKRLQRELEVFEVLQKKSLALCLSMEMNFCFSLYYVYVSIRYHSQWFANLALFYTALAVARFVLLRAYRFDKISVFNQYKLYMKCGYMMFAMMAALFMMTVMVVNQNYSVNYPGISIYIAGAFSVYLIISAITGMISQHKYNSPLLRGQQMISVSAALLGLLSIQTAILSIVDLDKIFERNLNLLTGSAIFVILIFMSMHMIYTGAKKVNG